MLMASEPVSTSYLGRTHLYPAKVRSVAARGKCSSIPYAYTAGATAYSQAESQQRTGNSGKERLLRYPDGRVRCIRYPEVSAEAERLAEQLDPTVSYEEDWDPDRWDDIDWAWDVLSSQDNGSTGAVTTPLSRPLPQTSDLPQKVALCQLSDWLSDFHKYTDLNSSQCRPDIRLAVLQICCAP